MSLDDHEFGLRLLVVRPFTSPREMVVGILGVSGARVRMGGHRFSEDVDDGLAIYPGATKLVRAEIHPGPGQRAQRFHIPALLAWIVRAEIQAEHDELSGRPLHP